MYPAERVYAVDIETDTTVDGLNPAVARITEIALSTAAGDQVFAGGSEAVMLRHFEYALRQLDPGLVTTWNGTFFDLPFLADRYAIHRGWLGSDSNMHLMPQPGLLPKYSHLPGHELGYTATWAARSPDRLDRHSHLDIMWAYRDTARRLGVKWSLKPVATALGIDMVSVDRAAMHTMTAAARRDYACSDTRGTRELALRVLGAGNVVAA